ncbi:phosphatase, partial [Candidatus Beckwithbacteria bacterium CG23_combo_of_CG06-09_8_20_14_all_34_8]
MLKAIIFDLDDTLTQTRQTQYNTLKTTAKRFYNLEISDSDIDALYGTPYREFMQLLFRQCDDLDNII